MRIPARYVSGYLATESANATHVWTEVRIAGIGWRGLDPTHNCQPGENYVKIGVGATARTARRSADTTAAPPSIRWR